MVVGGTVAFFETEAQLEALLVHVRDRHDHPTLVALSAAADEAAERHGLAYVTIEDLYSEEELVARGETLAPAEELAAALDAALASTLEHADAEPPSTRAYLYWLKCLIDAILHRGLTLTRALDRLAPEHVILFAEQARESPQSLNFVEESLSFLVLPLLIEPRGIATTLLDPPLPTRPEQRLHVGLRLRTHAVRLRDLFVHEVSRRRRTSGPAAGLTLMLATFQPDRDVVASWRHAGGAVVDAPRTAGRSNQRSPLLAACAKIVDDPQVRRLFDIEGVDLLPVAEPRLRMLIVDVMAQHVQTMTIVEGVLGTLTQPVLLGMAPIGVRDAAAFAAARRAGVPCAVHQHGGLVGYADFLALRFTDLAPADAYFCYGEGTARAVAGEDVRPVPVGSSALDRLRPLARTRASRSAGRRVVYVPTHLTGDTRYFSGHAYPDIWYWRLQRDVVSLCSRFDDLEVVAKLVAHQDVDSPLERWIRERGWANVRVLSATPFRETLADADLVITDSLSTPLLESLAAGCPTVLLGDTRWTHVRPEARQLLAECTVFTTARETFLSELERVLGLEDWSVLAPRNDRFLRAYGTHLDDGGSADRAANALIALAQGGSRATGRRPPA